MMRIRKAHCALLAVGLLWLATAPPLAADDFRLVLDESYATVRFEYGKDLIEFVFPTDRYGKPAVWANGAQFHFSPGFVESWLQGSVSDEDHASLIALRARLHDPAALSAALTEQLEREYRAIQEGIQAKRTIDPCSASLMGGLWAAYGVGVIGTSIGCATAVTGVGAVACAGGVVGTVGGAVGFVIASRRCDEAGGAPSPGPEVPPEECPVDYDEGEEATCECSEENGCLDPGE